MRRGIGKLYHLAEASNLASILQHGLMSTQGLLDFARIAKPRRDVLLRVHRPDNIRLSNGVVIRDQRPMPPAALMRALDDGLEPSDWYALLNSFVFLWPDPERMERQRRACSERPQVVLSRSTQMLCSIGLRLKLSCRRSIAATRAAKRHVAGRRLSFPTQPGCGTAGRRSGAHVLQLKFCSVAPFLWRRRI
jgi:hypothetical protein